MGSEAMAENSLRREDSVAATAAAPAPAGGCCSKEDDDSAWELADLEERVKNLLAPPSAMDLLPPPPPPSSLPPSSNNDPGVSHPPLPSHQVDLFLKEALQKPRDRLFILRLEQEVDKFMRNPNAQQLELQPMPSSYLRLAAHRVVQHYALQSIVVDCNAPEGARIIARKTPETRFPPLRLADIPAPLAPVPTLPAPLPPTNDSKAEITAPPQWPPPRLAIMQRPRKASRHNGRFHEIGQNSRSVEERKEEYNKARARIFSCEDLVGKASVSSSLEEEENNNNNNILLTEESGSDLHKLPLTPHDVRADSGDNDNVDREPPPDHLPASIRTSLTSNCVAIFRDREKDCKDPDYDRSYDRYSHKFNPGFGLNMGGLHNMQAIYAPPPMVNFNMEFPTLGLSTRSPAHIHSDLVPAHLANQHTRGGPWFNSCSSMGYGHLDSMMGGGGGGVGGGPFNPGPAMYLKAPAFTFPSPALSYHMYTRDPFQQSLSQPPPQGSLGQAQRH